MTLDPQTLPANSPFRRLWFDENGAQRTNAQVYLFCVALYCIGYFISEGRRVWL
jgi:hypothetical protein